MDVDWLTNSDWLKVFVITPTILLFLILCVLANIKNLLEEFNGRNKNSVHLLESALGITYAQTAQTNPEGIIQKLDEIIDSTHAAKTTLESVEREIEIIENNTKDKSQSGDF